MPEIQIARMEKRDACKADEEGNAFIRRAIGMNGDRAERLLIARRHANAAIGLRNVEAREYRLRPLRKGHRQSAKNGRRGDG